MIAAREERQVPEPPVEQRHVDSTMKPALLLVSGRLVGFVAAFCIPIVLVRLFDQHDFGTYKQIFLIAATLYTVGQLGMAESLYYFLPHAPRDGARYATNALLALSLGGLVCLGALAAGAEPIGRALSNPDLPRYMPLLGVYLLLMLTSALLEVVMTSRKRFGLASWAYASLDLLRAGFLVLPVLLVPRLDWLLLGAVGFAALRCATVIGYLGWEFGGTLRPDGRLLRQQIAYALPFQLSAIVEIAQLNLHQYVVAHRFDPATFAIYSVGCLQIPLVEVVFTSVVNIMMVRMAEELRDGRAWAVHSIWHDTVRKLALLFFPVATLVLVAARPLIEFLFTDAYTAATPILMVSTLVLFIAPVAVDGALDLKRRRRRPHPHRRREGGCVGLPAEICDLRLDRRHPLTAPAVMPRTSQRCATKKARTTGIVETTPAAMSCP
jgi:O-antigen/teichoic acid export membrane protein